VCLVGAPNVANMETRRIFWVMSDIFKLHKNLA
jgi:hypothetical protein